MKILKILEIHGDPRDSEDPEDPGKPEDPGDPGKPEDPGDPTYFIPVA